LYLARRPTLGSVDIEASLEQVVTIAAEWIASSGEVLAVARFSRAAGNRDYQLFDDPEAFATWAFSQPPDTNLLVLQDYDLPFRGRSGLIANALPDESEVEWLLMVEGGGFEGRDTAWECWGTAEVREHLSDYQTECVVAGRMPAWNPAVVNHAPDTLSAVVPRGDGTAHRGIY